MTAVDPRRARTRTRTRYRGVVYGFDVVDHETGQIRRNDYVGQTRQRGRARENQHRDTQPWADLIVGPSHVLWEGECTDAELAEMERRFIQDAAVRPRLNVELNEDNPHRIPKWKQVEQRHERDRAARRVLWVPYEQRQRVSLLEWDTPDRPGFDRDSPVRQNRVGLTSRQRKIIGWGIAWLTVTLTAWITAVVEHWGGWEQTGSDSVATVTAVLGWLAAGCPISDRRRARRWRKRLWR